MRLTPTIVEIVIKAPMAARAFKPGQFYRLQNYETLAPRVDGTTLAMEGLALTGARVDRATGLLSTIVLEMGGSSDLCALLQPGEPVILMGPTGTPTETPAGETVLLVGGGLGNAVLFSIGAALRANGSRVLYFAGYKRVADRYKVADIEQAADCVVWCCDEPPGFTPGRPQDRAFVGNIVAAIAAYGAGDLDPVAIPLAAVDRIVAIGSEGMMNAVAEARHQALARVFAAGAPGDRLDQLADAMHDEGDLRAMPAAPPGSGDRHRDRGVFLLQPGSGDGPGRFRGAAPPPFAERRPGKIDQAVDRPLSAAPRPPPGAGGGVEAGQCGARLIEEITRHREELGALCRRLHVHRLDLFGSAARRDFDPGRSDLDFIVEFEHSTPLHPFDAYFELRRAGGAARSERRSGR